MLSSSDDSNKSGQEERDPLLVPSDQVDSKNDKMDEFSDDEIDDDDDLLENCSLDSCYSDEDSKQLELRVKSFQDVTVIVDRDSTVLQLKEKIVSALGKEAENRYLRLICKGRLVAPDAAVLQTDMSYIHSGDVVHAVLATAGTRGGPQAALQRGLGLGFVNSISSATGMSRRAFRGTGINAQGLAVRTNYDEDEDSSDNEVDIEMGNNNGNSRRRERLGFDRLRGSGLHRAEVTAIRAYFSRHVDRWIRQNRDVAEAAAGGETDLLRRRLLQEDAWMRAQGPASEFRLNLAGATSLTAAALRNNASLNGLVAGGPGSTMNMTSSEAVWRSGGVSTTAGTDRDFLWGFILGFFVGYYMLVWLWIPTVPHKQKLGILTGIIFQLTVTVMNEGNNDIESAREGLGEDSLLVGGQ